MAKYIASEFERFKTECLRKQTPAEIAVARLLFYAGVLAAVDAINKALGSSDPTALFQNMERLLDECAAFKEELMQLQRKETNEQ